MAYELIPYPISILFLWVFWFAVMVVLWKLRNRGRFYYFLYVGGLAATVLFIVLIGYLAIAGMSGFGV